MVFLDNTSAKLYLPCVMNLYFSTTTAVDVSEKPTSKQVASPWQRPAVEDQEGSENGEEESKKMFA